MADELFDKQYRSTTPTDLTDPPRFAQVLETTADGFVLGLRTFFAQEQPAGRFDELPTVEKYIADQGGDFDPFLTTVKITQEFPDILEQLPHLAVTAVGARNRRTTVGVPLIAQVQYPPRIEGSAGGPFDLSTSTTVDGEFILQYRTQPQRRGTWVDSQVVLRQSRFADWTQATLADVVRVINEQALYVTAFETPESTIAIQCGGVGGGDARPNVIEITGANDPALLPLLGLSAGQTDNSFNTARPVRNRYHMAAEVTVNVDVISTDPNTRRELTDLVYSWATFWMERDYYELQGRSWQDEDVNAPEEWYHIIFHQEVSAGAFQAVDRLTDPKDKVHIQRVTIPVTTFQYIDRPVRFSTGANFILQESSLSLDSTLPGRS